MPIYGYRCQSCHREFETVQRMSDPSQAACPDCGGAGTRLFFPAGILFKGSGFYKTDSRTSSAAASPTAGDETSTSTPDSSSPSSTPAPATPAPAATPAAKPTAKPGGSASPATASKD